MAKEPPNARALRKGRVSLPDQVYLITAATEARRPYFAHFANARRLVRVMQAEQERCYAETLCFVVMPDHFHWLMRLGERDTLATVVRRVKSLTSRKIGKRVWQRGFHDRAIRREEDLRSVARYVVENPLRAGLVECIGDYPHWDAMWL